MSLPKFGSYLLALFVLSFFAVGTASPQEAESQEDSTAASTQKEGDEKTTTAAASTGDAAKGETIFQQNCEICHDAKSNEALVGPGLKGVLKKLPESHTTSEGTEHKEHTVAMIRKQIEEGGGGMMPMQDILSKEEIDNIIAYLQTL